MGLLALVPQLARAAEKVAVMDLATPGSSADAGHQLNDSLVGIIAASVAREGYSVISTADIRVMLSFEQQKALLGCEDQASCLSEIGGALGVDLIVTGTVARLGDEYSVSLILLNARRAEVVRRFLGQAGTSAVLDTTVERGVAVLFGKAQDVGGTGVVLVKTEPPGALISLDGKDAGRSPMTLDAVAVGDHEIRARLGELSGSARLTVTRGVVARINLLLETPAVKLKILSDPPEAGVVIDGVARGTTPLILDNIASGAHLLRLEHEGHVPHEEKLNLSLDAYERGGREALGVNVRLVPRARFVPSLAAGGVLDAQEPLGGAAGFLEGAVLVSKRLELGAGLTSPLAFFGTLRVIPYRGRLELGMHLRAGGYLVGASGSEASSAGWFAGGGASAGVTWESALGLVGVRLEGTASFDLRAMRLVIPVALLATWRPQ